MKQAIKYTPQGFSYVDITLEDCLNWGGLGICNDCGEGPFKELKLIYVLGDTYCEKCFDDWQKRAKSYSREDIEHDLKIQKGRDIKWYKYHLDK